MNEIEATQADYDALNRGSDQGQLSRGFTDFSMRAMDLWFSGKDSNARSGIVPATFPPEADALALDFWLIGSDTRKRFRCWLMDKVPRETHAALFRELYPSGQRDNDPDSGGSVEAGAGLTMSPNYAEAVGQNEAEGSTKEVVASAPTPTTRKRKKRKRKPDMVDPFGGLLY